MLGIAPPAFLRLARKAYHLRLSRRSPRDIATLESTNRDDSRAPLLGTAPAVVSMTTHGERLSSVHLAIESIGRGDFRPSRLVLWVDDADAYAKLPEPLVRLQRRGLEVRLTENFGPHTKYWPYVREEAGTDRDLTLVTADDDVLAPAYWLRQLIQRSDDTSMTCYRAHTFGMTPAGAPTPYNSWNECWNTAASFAHFGTGVSGMAYAGPMLDALRRRGDAFRNCAPRADDVWLHEVSVSVGIPTKQVWRFPLEFPLAPGSQEQGLYVSNVGQSRNDDQIAATYGESTLNLIRKASGLSSHG